MKKQKIFGSIPQATVRIGVPQPTAALLLHMITKRFGAITISLKDIEMGGAILEITTLIDNSNIDKGYKDVLTITENDNLKPLKNLVNQMIEDKIIENDDKKMVEHYRQLNEEEVVELEENVDWDKYWEENGEYEKALLDL